MSFLETALLAEGLKPQRLLLNLFKTKDVTAQVKKAII